MASVLDRIVEHKNLEIKQLYGKHTIETLQTAAEQKSGAPDEPLFYVKLRQYRQAGKPFFISEFKRKSPSEGWINRDADLPDQLLAYARAGAAAVSVLTDTEFFGGNYDDLKAARHTLDQLPADERPLLLQKDFILDPIQLYLAKIHGADIILLIAAVLPPQILENLRRCAENLNLGVLVEVHDAAELAPIRHLDFPVLGVNNRDLKTFRTALNRVNALRSLADGRLIVAESGLRDYRDFQIVRRADAFLIGTSLMQSIDFQNNNIKDASNNTSFFQRFQCAGRLLFKACGIRTPDLLRDETADFIGINFSPKSKRRYDHENLPLVPTDHAVALFYGNTEDEIRAVLAKYPFKTVQLYANDVSLDFVKSLRQKVLLACSLRNPDDLRALEAFAPHVDLFILDGAQPGSGQQIETAVPEDFPYPFLLAGGLSADNLDRISVFRNCIGVDVASGIETDGRVDPERIEAIKLALGRLSEHFFHAENAV